MSLWYLDIILYSDIINMRTNSHELTGWAH